MGIASNKYLVFVHFLSLIQRAYTPADNLTSHPDATVGKMKEAAIVGFKGLYHNELHSCDFSAQCLHYLATHVSSTQRWA